MITRLLVSVVGQTPFMKLGNAKDLYVAVSGQEELLNSCSYIAELTRLALGLSESAQGFVGAQLGSNNADDLGLHVSDMSGKTMDPELAQIARNLMEVEV